MMYLSTIAPLSSTALPTLSGCHTQFGRLAECQRSGWMHCWLVQDTNQFGLCVEPHLLIAVESSFLSRPMQIVGNFKKH